MNISPIDGGAGSIVETGIVGEQIRLYYHQDLRGTVDYLTSPVSQKVESWTHYNEWGEITHNAVVRCGYREFDLVKNYTGHEYDAVLNLYYAKARMYDAENRRFTSVDPILDASRYEIAEYVTNPRDLVQYLYVQNNPLIFVDPLGKYFIIKYDGVGEPYYTIEREKVSTAYTGIIISAATPLPSIVESALWQVILYPDGAGGTSYFPDTSLFDVLDAKLFGILSDTAIDTRDVYKGAKSIYKLLTEGFSLRSTLKMLGDNTIKFLVDISMVDMLINTALTAARLADDERLWNLLDLLDLVDSDLGKWDRKASTLEEMVGMLEVIDNEFQKIQTSYSHFFRPALEFDFDQGVGGPQHYETESRYLLVQRLYSTKNQNDSLNKSFDDYRGIIYKYLDPMYFMGLLCDEDAIRFTDRDGNLILREIWLTVSRPDLLENGFTSIFSELKKNIDRAWRENGYDPNYSS